MEGGGKKKISVGGCVCVVVWVGGGVVVGCVEDGVCCAVGISVLLHQDIWLYCTNQNENIGL